MDAKVLTEFRDAATWKAYKPGDVFTGTPGRVGLLACMGLVEKEQVKPPLGSLTVKQLLEVCADEGVKPPSKATKATLIRLIESNRGAL